MSNYNSDINYKTNLIWLDDYEQDTAEIVPKQMAGHSLYLLIPAVKIKSGAYRKFCCLSVITYY